MTQTTNARISLKHEMDRQDYSGTDVAPDRLVCGDVRIPHYWVGFYWVITA